MGEKRAKPRLLDLFCGAGGCAMGYHRAGFEVVGVDRKPQKNYPFPMVVADAMKPPFDLSKFDVIHASPPCQAYSRSSRHAVERNYPDLVGSVREMLTKSGRPWVIENVVGSPLDDPAVLCGVSFGLGEDVWYLSRHRHFESSVLLMFPPHSPHPKSKAPLCIAGHGTPSWGRERILRITGKKTQPKAVCRRAMGIDWMTWQELTQAIPPAYTEYIGKQLMRVLESSHA